MKAFIREIPKERLKPGQVDGLKRDGFVIEETSDSVVVYADTELVEA